MSQPASPLSPHLRLSPADRDALRRRLMVDRPLHWDLARALFAALEVAWDELARARAHNERQPPETTASFTGPDDVTAMSEP